MSPTVLVVEDYADLRLTIRETLTRGEYDCDCVSNADAAIDMLRDHEYSAILLSPTLPVVDDPVVHYLLEHQPEEVSKVILMISPGETSDDYRVLNKPFNSEQLLNLLHG